MNSMVEMSDAPLPGHYIISWGRLTFSTLPSPSSPRPTASAAPAAWIATSQNWRSAGQHPLPAHDHTGGETPQFPDSGARPPPLRGCRGDGGVPGPSALKQTSWEASTMSFGQIPAFMASRWSASAIILMIMLIISINGGSRMTLEINPAVRKYA